jgi:hypothetical protein
MDLGEWASGSAPFSMVIDEEASWSRVMPCSVLVDGSDGADVGFSVSLLDGFVV